MTARPLVKSKGPTETCMEISACFLGGGCPDSSIHETVAQEFPHMFHWKPVFVSCGCCDRLSQIGGLKTT